MNITGGHGIAKLGKEGCGHHEGGFGGILILDGVCPLREFILQSRFGILRPLSILRHA